MDVDNCYTKTYTFFITDKHDTILAYLNTQLTVGEKILRAKSFDGNRPLPRRSVALVIDKYLRDFREGKKEPRWVGVPGLRGVGKTTLLAQLYTSLPAANNHKIYLSLDDALRSLGVSIKEILDVYQEILGTTFEELKVPTFIFLDEVQYDKTWAITIKTLYDRTTNVFFLCTGSSALSINTNPDIARRIAITKIYPLTFTEYEMIKNRRFPIQYLASSIREAIFSSNTAEEVYNKLSELSKNVETYWRGLNEQDDVTKYLKFGSLPSALSVGHEPLIYSQINQTLNSVLNRDVPELGTFDKQTIDKLSQILYVVSSYEATSFNKISQMVGLDYRVVSSIFDALEKTELLIRVNPQGAHESQSTKPSKYHFTSPAFRSMYYNLIGSTITFDDYKGKLFEDVVCFYLHRIFSVVPNYAITYDSKEGGADFILGTKLTTDNRIVIEASLGKKGSRQVLTTIERHKSKYGLVISSSPLRIDETKTAVNIPLRYFLLI